MSKELILEDNAFLVSETDEQSIIIFANDDFCEFAEYSVDELIGKPHNVVRHPDMPKAAFKDLWATIKRGDIWTGFVKNTTRNGNFYWVYATIYPTMISEGKKGYLSCRRKATREEIETHEKLYKELRAKE